MPTLTYLDNSFDCAVAIKGDNYIHLLDENGIMVAGFDGITDFSPFSLSDGDYTSPTADHDCPVAVLREDGTIGKGSHTCADIAKGVAAVRTVNGAAPDKNGNVSVSVEGAVVSDVDFSGWDDGEFTMIVDGEEKAGSVEFDSDGIPTSVTVDGHTLTITLPA